MAKPQIAFQENCYPTTVQGLLIQTLRKLTVIWVVQWPCLKVQRYRRRRSKRYRAKFQLQQRETSQMQKERRQRKV